MHLLGILLCPLALASPLARRGGSAASEVAECSNSTASIYSMGGNAIDAAIATILCVGTIAHHHSGIGGGGFALIRLPNGTTHFLDFREMAPAASSEGMFLSPNSSSLVGGLASGVPGELRGLEEMSRRWGRLKWEKLFQPAIKYAEGGFTVNRDLDVAANTTIYPFLLQEEAWRRDWFGEDGGRVKVGEKMYRQRYARTLRAVAKGGADVFYKGSMARRTVQEVQKRGGILTVEDLEGYRVRHRRVNTVQYKGYRLSAGSAPSSGAVVLSALKIFEGWNETKDRGLETHRLVEGIKFAYGQRTQLGDPDFVDRLEVFQIEMMSEEVAAGVRETICDVVLPNISFYDPEGIVIPTPWVFRLFVMVRRVLTCAGKEGRLI